MYASEARTATPTAPQIVTEHADMLVVVIDVTAVDLTPSVVPTIDGLDPVSGQWFNLLTGAAITAIGTTVLRVGRGATAVSNEAANDAIPFVTRVVMTHADADSITYSVSAMLGK